MPFEEVSRVHKNSGWDTSVGVQGATCRFVVFTYSRQTSATALGIPPCSVCLVIYLPSDSWYASKNLLATVEEGLLLPVASTARQEGAILCPITQQDSQR